MKTLTEQLHEQLHAYLPDDIAENVIDRVEAIKAESVSDTKKACKREARKDDYFNEWEPTNQLESENTKGGEDYSAFDFVIDKAEVTG